MIYSMTPDERVQPELVMNSLNRRLRIAKGSGVSLKEVNDLCKQFEQMRKMIRQFKRLGFFGKIKMAMGMGKGRLMGDGETSVKVSIDTTKQKRKKKREERKKKRKLLKKQKRRQR